MIDVLLPTLAVDLTPLQSDLVVATVGAMVGVVGGAIGTRAFALKPGRDQSLRDGRQRILEEELPRLKAALRMDLSPLSSQAALADPEAALAYLHEISTKCLSLAAADRRTAASLEATWRDHAHYRNLTESEECYHLAKLNRAVLRSEAQFASRLRGIVNKYRIRTAQWRAIRKDPRVNQQQAP